MFDLETQRLAHEVGGWSHADQLGLAAAVTLNVDTGEVRRFVESDAAALIEHLRSARRVIGYNVLSFDYRVLQPYGFFPEGVVTVDLLDHLYRRLGFHVSLDNVANATLGEQKTADGFQAVAWFRQGRLDKVLEYCEADVRLTYRLWDHGRLNQMVRYRDRDFRLKDIRVVW